MRVATLNVQNLRLLRSGSTAYLHGAWDADDPENEAFDPIDRRLTARLICDVNPDVLILQEVFDLETLAYFHDTFLVPTGVRPYRHQVCLSGNDGRGMNVALLSRHSIEAIKSHAAVTPYQLDLEPPAGVDPDLPVFRRDCLMATIGKLTVFACHFKSPYPDPEVAWAIRRLEALATRRIIEREFEEPEKELWLIVGDLNEPGLQSAGSERAIHPIEGPFSVDLMQRLPASERWTFYDRHSGAFHCPDALLASPALAQRWPACKPFIVRKGLDTASIRTGGARYVGVGQNRPHASDHAAIAIDLEGLN